MANVVRQGVEGIGISPSLPKLCGNSYFTEVAIPETVILPTVKPDIEELLSVMVDAKIVSLRIIKTPEGTSKEGQHLTGRKLSIELNLRQKVKYIANEPTQSVHAAHFENIVNSIWIVVPKTINYKGTDVPIETLLLQGKLIVTPYIEDIYGEQLDKRTIFKNITLLINVVSNCSGEAALTLTKSGTEDSRTISYTVEIENTGQIDARNVMFSDTLTTTASVAYNLDLEVDGAPVPGSGTINIFSEPINIGDIPACTTVTVTYSVTVNGVAAETVDNQASTEYEYKPCSPDTTTNDSNSLTIPVPAP
ncbi:DUF7507 domain-containing protein [Clostridium sp. DL1XJH146]